MMKNEYEVEVNVTAREEWPNRFWEPGCEDADEFVLPESEWLPEEMELPFM